MRHHHLLLECDKCIHTSITCLAVTVSPPDTCQTVCVCVSVS